MARARVGAADMTRWIARYDGAGIETGPPGADTLAGRLGVATILSSPMPRATASARRVARGRGIVVLPDAFEAPLPVARGARLRLPPALWLGILRAGWFCGWEGGVETPAETRHRAAGVAEDLQRYAARDGAILFVGHGVLNHFIARVLRRRGWSGPRFPARGYWRHSLYAAPNR